MRRTAALAVLSGRATATQDQRRTTGLLMRVQ